MDTQVLALIESMATTTVDFASDVVTQLWPLFLSLAVLAFAFGFVLRKTRISR
jgi:hypothetical protein